METKQKKQMVQRRWASSDPHFGHRLVAGLRGFHKPDGTPSTLLHDATIIANWNKRVGEDDLVFLLGDLGIPRSKGAMEYIWRCVSELHGQIVLVPGNHDAVHPMHKDSWQHRAEWEPHFRAIQTPVKLRLEGEEVLLAHHPYTGDRGRDRDRTYRMREQGAIMPDGTEKPPLTIIHGHTHLPERVSRTPQGTIQIHVGLDAWNLEPVSMDTIMRIMREERVREAA